MGFERLKTRSIPWRNTLFGKPKRKEPKFIILLEFRQTYSISIRCSSCCCLLSLQIFLLSFMYLNNAYEVVNSFELLSAIYLIFTNALLFRILLFWNSLFQYVLRVNFVENFHTVAKWRMSTWGDEWRSQPRIRSYVRM